MVAGDMGSSYVALRGFTWIHGVFSIRPHHGGNVG